MCANVYVRTTMTKYMRTCARACEGVHVPVCVCVSVCMCVRVLYVRA